MLKVSKILKAAFPQYGYHATFLRNLDSIAANGLRPSGGSQFNGGYDFHSKGRVFLCGWNGVFYWMNKMEMNAGQYSDFNTYDDFGWTPITLRVNMEGFKNDPDIDDLGAKDSTEDAWYVSHVIGPEDIEVWNGRGWVEVDSADFDAMMEFSKAHAEHEVDSADEPQTEEEWFDTHGEDDEEENGWWNLDFDVFMPKAP